MILSDLVRSLFSSLVPGRSLDERPLCYSATSWNRFESQHYRVVRTALNQTLSVSTAFYRSLTRFMELLRLFLNFQIPDTSTKCSTSQFLVSGISSFDCSFKRIQLPTAIILCDNQMNFLEGTKSFSLLRNSLSWLSRKPL